MAGSSREALWRICDARPAPVTPRWRTRSSSSPAPTLAEPTLAEGRSLHEQDRNARLVLAARDAAGLEGLSLAVAGWAAEERLCRVAGDRRLCRVHARLRVSDAGP